MLSHQRNVGPVGSCFSRIGKDNIHNVTYDTSCLVCSEVVAKHVESRSLHYAAEKGASSASVRLTKANK